jgi:hypothetical protein
LTEFLTADFLAGLRRADAEREVIWCQPVGCV